MCSSDLTADYVLDYARFQLGNNDDEVVFTNAGGTVLDQVSYTTTEFPDTKGFSMQLQTLDTTSNDAGASWCAGTATYGTDGNVGTPGAANDGCSTDPSKP